MRGEKETGDLVFLASPPSQQAAHTLSARTGTSGTLSPLVTNSVLLNGRLQCSIHTKEGAKGVRVKEAPLPDIPALASTCWAGPQGHFEVTPEGWPCRMEPIARRGCGRTISQSLGNRLRGGNSRPGSVSCPSRTQAELGRSSFPRRTFSVCLLRTRGSAGPLLTQTLWNAGPLQRRFLGGTAALHHPLRPCCSCCLHGAF